MDARAKNATAPTSYVDFDPSVERVQDEAAETLVLRLPGFAREHLKVLLGGGNLRIRGERPLDGNQRSRFQKDFQVPDTCNASEIRAKFENGVLSLILPKLITRAEPVEAKVPPPAPPKATAPEPKPSADQQKATQKAEPTPSGHEETKEKEKERADGPVPARKAAGDDVKDKEGYKDGGLNGKKKMEPPEEKRITAAGVVSKRSWSEKFKFGKPGLRTQLLLNVVVAVMVFVGLGMYVTYKLRKHEKGDEKCGILSLPPN